MSRVEARAKTHTQEGAEIRDNDNVGERDTGRDKHKEERRTNKGEEERDNRNRLIQGGGREGKEMVVWNTF